MALALIFVVIKNTAVKASISSETTIAQLEEEAFDDSFENDDDMQMTDSADTNEEETIANDNNHSIKLKSGDTLLNILTATGVDYNNANDVYMSVKKVFNPRDFRAGQQIDVENTDSNGSKVVNTLSSTIRTGERLKVTLNNDGSYTAAIEKDELIEELLSASGRINGTLSHSMSKNGVPSKIVANFISIFSYSVDLCGSSSW